MITLDTHIRVWHVQGDRRLTADYIKVINQYEPIGLGISAISLWEIAKAVEHGKLSLPMPIKDWFQIALNYPGIRILPLLRRLPLNLHSFPAYFTKTRPTK